MLCSGQTTSGASTLGTFLRAFTFGYVRQLDEVLADCVSRAWAAGAGPGEERLVVDVDSFVGEVRGKDKQGARSWRLLQAPAPWASASPMDVTGFDGAAPEECSERSSGAICDETPASCASPPASAAIPRWRNASFVLLEPVALRRSDSLRIQLHHCSRRGHRDRAWSSRSRCRA